LVLSRDSKESKLKVQEEINQRIKDTEDTDKYEPIIIFPEGGTTNGKYLIKFKRGAFVSLRSVFPKIQKYHSFWQSPCSGVIDGMPHYLMSSSNPFTWSEVIHLPIFKPNDYFF